MLKEPVIVNPAENIFSADCISELIASESAIDFDFTNKDFPLTFKRKDFPAGQEFSKTMRLTYRCTASADSNRLVGKEFSIPFYSLKYLVEENGESIFDAYARKEQHLDAMSFTDSFEVLSQAVAKPDDGTKPLTGKMYAYSRLAGYTQYIEDKAKGAHFSTLRTAILATGPVPGQEKRYLRKLTLSEPVARFFESE